MKITRSKLVDWVWVDFEDNMNEIELAEYKKSLIPQELTPRQIRLALIQSGVNISSIDTIISWLQEPTKTIAKTLREYSLSYKRDDEMLMWFAWQLGMNDEQLDKLFILGSTI